MQTPTIEEFKQWQEHHDALLEWMNGPDGLWTRGNPKKVPYEVKATKDVSAASAAYWEHYGFPAFVEHQELDWSKYWESQNEHAPTSKG
jgi:hypothetical protein